MDRIEKTREPGVDRDDSGPVVQMVGVTFQYGAQTVLDGIDLKIHRGQIFGVIGPNGGGKSTLAKLITGRFPPRRGRVTVFGKPAHLLGREKKRLGFVAQRSEVAWSFPANVLDVTMMGRVATRGLFHPLNAEDREIAMSALQRVGMESLSTRAFDELSGGQQQRVFIARALAAQAELLILDEPTAGLDAASQRGFFELLPRLSEDLGLTVLLISHDVDYVVHFAQRVVCLNRTIHWHDRAELFNEQAVLNTYGCELGVHFDASKALHLHHDHGAHDRENDRTTNEEEHSHE